MTPEEITALQETGESPEAIAAQQAQDAEAARLAAEQKAKDDVAAKDALLLGLTPEEVEKTPHFRKMAFALREEMRQKEAVRLLVEAENARIKAELDAKARTENEKDEEPDTLVTVAELNRRMEAKIAQLKKDAETQRMQEDAVVIKQRLAESEEKARASLTADKMGTGLDYDSVFAACQRQIQVNPAYAQVILSAKDPARQAYDIGLLDPSIQTLREARQMELTLSKIKDGGSPPKVGGGGNAPAPIPGDLSMEELLNLSPAELEKRTIALEQQGG